MAESKEELKSLLMNMKKESEIDGLKLNIHGLEESTLSKWPYYPKQSTDSMQSLSSYQQYFSQN